MKVNNQVIDWYHVKARLFPTALTTIPILFLYFQFIHPLVFNFSIAFNVIIFLEGLAIYSAVTFLLVHITRSIGKFIFEKYIYDDEMKMPTTESLLISTNLLSNEGKDKIRRKVTEHFGVTFSDEKAEKKDESEARRKVIEGVSYIKNVTRGNKAIEQHNREYGFIRNFTGGCLLAILFSLLGILLAYKFAPESIINYTVLVAIYLLLFLWGVFMIKSYGNSYAKVLFQQFMSNS